MPNYGFVTTGNKKWFNPNIPKYPQNPAKALELLKEIGIEKRNGDDFLTDADGHKIEFVLNTNVGNGPREKAAVLIASDLEKLGMKVIFQPIDFNTLIDRMDNLQLRVRAHGHWRRRHRPGIQHERYQIQRLFARMVSAPENAFDRLGGADWII